MYLIRNISCELLNKTPLITNILLKFEDKEIKKAFYDFIKYRLDNFKLDVNKECPININSQCDHSKELLLIEIILSIPDLIHKPLDLDMEQIVNHLSYKFIKFYENEIQIFKNKNGD